jgi:hypothetical protein
MCERVVSSAPLGLMMAPGTALPVCRLDLDALTIVLPLKVAMLVTTCTQERLRRFFLPAAGWAVGLSAVFWIDTAALFQHAGHAHGNEADLARDSSSLASPRQATVLW